MTSNSGFSDGGTGKNWFLSLRTQLRTIVGDAVKEIQQPSHLKKNKISIEEKKRK